MGTTKVAEQPKQGRGKTLKEICPECHCNYLVAAYIHKGTFRNQKWKKIGLYCIGCNFFKPSVSSEESES